ncbi:MAG: DUF47 family protein [Bacilli bacterium]|nr:DUF47 family protein [Bacilli bacterium]
MKKREVNFYFKTFAELFQYTKNASIYLNEVISKFTNGISEEQKDIMHNIEHSADLCLHDALEKLAKEFITPIENEDILSIIKTIDDATDVIEETLIRMYIHNITKIPTAAVTFANIIQKECIALEAVLNEFPNFKKSNTLKDLIMEVLDIESEGDKLYISSIRELYEKPYSFEERYLTENLINSLEECCDAIEEIAQVIDEAVMKNM